MIVDIHAILLCKMGVLIPFVTSILFGLLLPTSDVTLDAKFMEKTLTFNVGNTLELIGCKLCYKSENLVYRKRKGKCSTCLVNDYKHECGGILTFLNEVNHLGGMDEENCNQEFNWRVTKDKKIVVPGAYTNNNSCAIEYIKNESVPKSTLNIDRRLFVAESSCLYVNLKQIKERVEACNIIGNASLLSCDRLTQEKQFSKMLRRYLTVKISQNKTPIWDVDMFRITQITRIDKNNRTKTRTVLKKGYNFDDGCGIIFKEIDFSQSDGTSTCNDDPCYWHLTSLKIRTNNIHDLSSWKEVTDYYLGVRVGGLTCKLLKIYGVMMLIPLLLNVTFSYSVFYNDYKDGVVKKYEVIPLLMTIYPQWKVLKYLGSYYFGHKNEDILRKEKMIYERDVATLEPFLEASIQVKPTNVIDKFLKNNGNIQSK